MSPIPDPSTLFMVAAIAVAVGYVGLVAFWPFKACRRRHGAGKLRAPIGLGLRCCPRCAGAGLRLRIVRRLWNYLTRH